MQDVKPAGILGIKGLNILKTKLMSLLLLVRTKPPATYTDERMNSIRVTNLKLA
jgi:hypothetical protein